ncbi:MAG: hypothetical protein GY822_25850 [Deltaproteobacteria bacterium]|nr:hypothetical protein [Deltaproteobacteria bacterium]
MPQLPSTSFSAGSGTTSRELTAVEERAFASQRRNARLVTGSILSMVVFGVLAMVWGQSQMHQSLRKKHNSARQLVSEIQYEGTLKHGDARYYFVDKAQPDLYRKAADGFGAPSTVAGIKSEGQFVKGRKHGLWRTYDSAGRKREEVHYTHGRWHGAYRSFHPNGALESEVHFGARERREGVGRSYFADGTLASEQPYQRGEIHGTERAWYQNGQLEVEAHVSEGVRNGRSRRWHKNGQLWSDGAFRFGSRIGFWKEYDEKGKLVLELDWGKGGEVVLRDDLAPVDADEVLNAHARRIKAATDG